MATTIVISVFVSTVVICGILVELSGNLRAYVNFELTGGGSVLAQLVPAA